MQISSRQLNFFVAMVIAVVVVVGFQNCSHELNPQASPPAPSNGHGSGYEGMTGSTNDSSVSK